MSVVRLLALTLLVPTLLIIAPHAVAGQPPAARTLDPAIETTYRFDIRAGTLEHALRQFEAITGCIVSRPARANLDSIASPGVAGVLSPARALELLLAGTGLTFRLEGSRVFSVTVATAPETVDVVGHVSPYRVDESTGATKTRTALRDIPQTVAIVPRDVLIDQRAQSVADAVRNVPGVSIAQGEGNRDQIVLRGISTASDFYVNGVRDDQERFRDLYNVESIEVVQGPAAVLFGRGGAGGIVNLVTRRPTPGAPADITFEAGAFGHKRAMAQFGAPLAGGGSLRVSTMGERSDGFRDAYFLNRYAVNPVAGWTFGRGSTLTVGFEHLRDHRLADRGIPSRAGRPADVRRSQLFGSPSQNDARSGVDSVQATLDHRLGPNLTLRNTLLVGRYDKSYQNVYPGSAVNAAGALTLSAYNHDIDRTNAFNQTDLIYTARFGGMAHTLLGGVEAGHQLQDELRHTAAAIPNVPIANAQRDANFASAPLVVDRHATSNVLAAYGQDQVTLSGRWKAVVGARVDRFSVGVTDHLAANPLSRTDTVLSPRAGLIYQPTSTASLYGSYSYTFLPSGQTLGLTPTTAQLGPENAKNYEAGAKLDLFQRRFTVAVAAFRLDRNNVKNTDPTDPAKLVLTGQQRTDGAIVSVAGNLTERWRVYGGASRLDARITADTTAAPAGRRVGLVPRNQLTLWSTFDVTAHIGTGAGIISQSRTYTSFTNQVTLPAFTRVDAMVFYRLGRYRLAANAENLFDTKYYPTANGDNNISPGAPRSLQFSLRAMF